MPITYYLEEDLTSIKEEARQVGKQQEYAAIYSELLNIIRISHKYRKQKADYLMKQLIEIAQHKEIDKNNLSFIEKSIIVKLILLKKVTKYT